MVVFLDFASMELSTKELSDNEKRDDVNYGASIYAMLLVTVLTVYLTHVNMVNFL